MGLNQPNLLYPKKIYPIPVLKEVFNFILKKLNEMEIQVSTERKFYVYDCNEELEELNENKIKCMMKIYVQNELNNNDAQLFRRCWQIAFKKAIEACEEKFYASQGESLHPDVIKHPRP